MRRRLAFLLIVLMATGTLAGCSPVLETDQARLCRMALPALSEPDAKLTIVRQRESADGRGVDDLLVGS